MSKYCIEKEEKANVVNFNSYRVCVCVGSLATLPNVNFIFHTNKARERIAWTIERSLVKAKSLINLSTDGSTFATVIVGPQMAAPLQQ